MSGLGAVTVSGVAPGWADSADGVAESDGAADGEASLDADGAPDGDASADADGPALGGGSAPMTGMAIASAATTPTSRIDRRCGVMAGVSPGDLADAMSATWESANLRCRDAPPTALHERRRRRVGLTRAALATASSTSPTTASRTRIR